MTKNAWNWSNPFKFVHWNCHEHMTKNTTLEKKNVSPYKLCSLYVTYGKPILCLWNILKWSGKNITVPRLDGLREAKKPRSESGTSALSAVRNTQQVDHWRMIVFCLKGIYLEMVWNFYLFVFGGKKNSGLDGCRLKLTVVTCHSCNMLNYKLIYTVTYAVI